MSGLSDFARFQRLCEARGVAAIDRGGGHWQARGKLLVNYYPFAKRGPTIYINGMQRSYGDGSFKQAIRAALDEPPEQPLGYKAKRMSATASLNAKRRLWRRREFGHACHWCRRPLEFQSATIEHVIPLHRGGSNRLDNLALSCAPCNHARGNRMPELKAI